jgi:hypothetical protein
MIQTFPKPASVLKSYTAATGRLFAESPAAQGEVRAEIALLTTEIHGRNY